MPKNPFSSSFKSKELNDNSKSSLNENFIKNLQDLNFAEISEENEQLSEINERRIEPPNFGFSDKPYKFVQKPPLPLQNLHYNEYIKHDNSETPLKNKLEEDLRDLDERIIQENSEIANLKRNISRSRSKSLSNKTRSRSNSANINANECIKKEIHTCKSQKYLRESPFRKTRTKSFNIENQKIEKVPSSTKQKIIEWLYDLQLLKRKIMNPEERLYDICREGVIFFDIINLAEGRGQEAIRGAHRFPKNKAHIKANYKRLMDYLRQKGKFNPKLLFAEDEIMNDNEDAFWGLLEDLWTFYNGNNIYNRSNEKARQFGLKSTSIQLTPMKIKAEIIPKKNIEEDNKYRCPIPQKIPKRLFENSERSIVLERPKSKPKSINKEIETNSISERKQFIGYKPKRNNDIKNQLKSSTSILTTPKKSSRKSIIISKESKALLDNWIKDLGLEFFLQTKGRYLFDDMFRNGVLLSEVLVKELPSESNKLKLVKYSPRNIDDCRKNLRLCMDIVREKFGTNLNSELFFAEEKLLEGDYDILYGIIQTIKDLKLEYSPFKVMIIKSEGFSLPYSNKEIEELTNTLENWLKNLFNIKENIIGRISNLQILDKIIKSKINAKFMLAYSKPETHKQKLANLRQCLTVFREQKNFGQKFLWNEADLLADDHQILIGLLEDIYRWCKGFPPRQGTNYFIDGPVLDNSENAKVPLNSANRFLMSNFIHKPNVNLDKAEDIDVNTLDLYHKVAINDWLKEWEFETLNWDIKIQKKFKNGTFLAKLFEKISNQKIAGIIYGSNNMNIALSNFRKCFAFGKKFGLLKSSKGEFDQNKCYNSEGEYISKLLLEIKNLNDIKRKGINA